ncbi:MAG: D-2-hydroxyacid dehydrogenase [Bacteroidia bacterium]|nr:D-2-hydroxyacid dehydrogenase [Bacteroidia bacterium]
MNIVYLDGYTLNPGDLDWRPLARLGNFKVYDNSSLEEGIERGKLADIILVNKFPVTRDVLKHWPDLKCVCVTATGYNNLDIPILQKRNIIACNAVGYSTPSTAQHTIALILALANKIGMYNADVQSDGWSNSNTWTYYLSPTIELQGLTLGIIGLGDIGKRVAKIASSLGLKIIATSRRVQSGTIAGIEMVKPTEIFRQSDFISLHLPLNKDSHHIINRVTLDLMKSSVFLINTSRGGLIHEDDLKSALVNQKIAGAALDVLSDEPPSANHPLIGLNNCIITPHMAWATVSSRQRLLDICIKNVEAFIKGKPRNTIA